MSISINRKRETIVIDVDKGTQDPVSEVVAALAGQSAMNRGRKLFIDMTGLKPSRFSSGDIGRLFDGLPVGSLPEPFFETYIVGLPEAMIPGAERTARDYVEGLPHLRPQLIVANKVSATRIAYQ